MKSYLSLIPISAKIHKRQNRMTILCIIFSVFLVTAVFSMAEMGIKMESKRLVDKHGTSVLAELLTSNFAQTFFPIAAVLGILILIAGVLMISGSMNSNVAGRTKFFGMMRCIGMSKQQIIRFVRLEALNWCKTAIPIGVCLGIAATWILCVMLRFFVGEEFSDIPIFGVSVIGIVSGVVVGIVTVLIAATAPAKQAAKVSPVTAVSGNAQSNAGGNHAANTDFFKIETSLGIYHAVSAGKNLILMTGSFALSIILFLSFSAFIDLVGYMMPQSYATPDIEIRCEDASRAIDCELADAIGAMDGMKCVYGRNNAFDISAELRDGTVCEIDLISYDDFDLDCLVKDKSLKNGSDISAVYGNSSYVIATWDPESSLQIGDKITVGKEELTIAGLLKYDPFTGSGTTEGRITLICSGDTFTRLTGMTGYSLLMIQTTKDAADEDVAAISDILDEHYSLKDIREQRTTNTYIAFLACVYGFLIIITLVSVLNIVNSISMSVSARTRQYGVMRAVGMNQHQITKMIAVEAFTYACFGCIVGCVAGLAINKRIYDSLITTHYAYAIWNVPFTELSVIVLTVLAATVIAIYTPVKRMCNMAITQTINEL